MSSKDRNSLIFSFQCGWLYLFFLPECPNRTSCTMLNRRGENDHPCLVSHLVSSPLSMMLAVAIFSQNLSSRKTRFLFPLLVYLVYIYFLS